MVRRAVTIVSFAASIALATACLPSMVAASTRHGSSLAAHDGSLSIGVGRGSNAARTLAPAAVHPLLTVPVPSAIQERRTTSPAAKPTHDPFPDFDVPLRRHRMAIPDSAIPALGDLSF